MLSITSPLPIRISKRIVSIPQAIWRKQLIDGRNIILTGEYGSGKSRCISEVFAISSAMWAESYQFPVAVNLRDCWGLQRSEEIVRRHFDSLGLDDITPAAVRAFNSRNMLFLIDGFDEIGVQSWSSDDARLRQLRSQALSGVRDIVQTCGTGTLIAGRDHYFSSNSEMLSALGLNMSDTLIVGVKEEFSAEEMTAYFEAAQIEFDAPEWLPRRPLMCQTISNLDADERSQMFGLAVRKQYSGTISYA